MWRRLTSNIHAGRLSIGNERGTSQLRFIKADIPRSIVNCAEKVRCFLFRHAFDVNWHVSLLRDLSCS